MLGHFICNSTCDAPKLCAEIIIILLGVEKIVGILMNDGTVWGGGGGVIRGKNALEIAWRQLSGGMVHRSLLIKNASCWCHG